MTEERGVGRPPHEPTPESRALISELSAFGITHEQMASRLKINIDTLKKHYERELIDGKTSVIQQVARRLVDKALDGDGTAQMFYLKTQGRWREKDPEEDTAGKALSLAEQILAHKKEQQKEKV